MTISRGNTPEDAFFLAKNTYLNGPEIRRVENYEIYEVPKGMSPHQFAFDILKKEPKMEPKKAGCVLIRHADPNAPEEHFFISQRIGAYLFFGYA